MGASLREASETERAETIFYDGECGACHWAVRFVARRDPSGLAFRFAPLGGETFELAVEPERAARLPDSLVVHTRRGELFVRSRAVVYILRRLGGGWALLGRLLALVPPPLRDFGYDVFARIRHRLFARPEGVCPILPPELGRRFDP